MYRLEKYIKLKTGIKVEIKKEETLEKIPQYLIAEYRYWTFKIEDKKCLLLELVDEKFNISYFLKHERRIKKSYSDYIIVLSFERMTDRIRQQLIEEHISYIVQGTEIYFPFLFLQIKETEEILEFTASEQLITFYLAYKNKFEYITSREIAKECKVSLMTVNRSIKKLENLGWLERKGYGRNTTYSLEYLSIEKILEHPKYFKTPVLEKVYVESNILEENKYPISGESFLAEHTNYGYPPVDQYAISRNEYKRICKEGYISHKNNNMIDLSREIELEVWKYDPLILCNKHSGYYEVDFLSFYFSLLSKKDERLYLEMKKIVNDYLGNI